MLPECFLVETDRETDVLCLLTSLCLLSSARVQVAQPGAGWPAEVTVGRREHAVIVSLVKLSIIYQF